MPEDSDDRLPEDELREMLQQFLSGEGPIDPARLAGAAGMPSDPAQLQALMAQLQAALEGRIHVHCQRTMLKKTLHKGLRIADRNPMAPTAAGLVGAGLVLASAVHLGISLFGALLH